jgi:hypothetical protein
MIDPSTTIRSFVNQQRAWLQQELQCDDDAASREEEGRSQHVLHQLEASDVSVGLYGRTVLTLVAISPPPAGGSSVLLLPAHRFTTGDEVEIRNNKGSHSGSKKQKHPGGVICQVTETSLSIALLDDSNTRNSKAGQMDTNGEGSFGPPLSLLPKSSIEVHKKHMLALDDLETNGTNHAVAGKVVQALFEGTSSSVESAGNSHHVSNPIQPFSKALNESQIQAISFALTENRPVALLHGPPGKQILQESLDLTLFSTLV